MHGDHESLLDELLECEDCNFTPWEIDFLESLHRQRDRDLSERQLDKLHAIARKAGLIER